MTTYWKTRKLLTEKNIASKTRKNAPQVKKRPVSKLYEFETLDKNMDRAKMNWIDHHNVNIKNISALKPAYEYKVYNPDGVLEPFRVGDLFVLRENKGN